VAAPERGSCAQEGWGRGGKEEKYVGGGGPSMAVGAQAPAGSWRRLEEGEESET